MTTSTNIMLRQCESCLKYIYLSCAEHICFILRLILIFMVDIFFGCRVKGAAAFAAVAASVSTTDVLCDVNHYRLKDFQFGATNKNIQYEIDK